MVAAASIALIVSRLPLLRSRTRIESLVSREAAFLYNNLFLVAFALTVLWGVAWPLVSEAVRGIATTVGAPYYNFFAIVFGLPLVLLMGLGPLVAWRRASLRSLGAQVAWPRGCRGGIGLLAGAGSSPAGLVGYTFAVFVLAAIVLEFVRGTRARKALGETSWPAAFASLVGRNRRRYGGYIVHAAIVLLLIGAVGIGAFRTTREATLSPGEAMRVGDYSLGWWASRDQRLETRGAAGAARTSSAADDRLGHRLGRQEPLLRQQQTSNEVAIRTDWLRAEDLFVIGDQFNADGSVVVKVLVNPLVNLIWLAGIVFLLGSVVTMWPDAREQRRLAGRLAEPRHRASPA